MRDSNAMTPQSCKPMSSSYTNLPSRPPSAAAMKRNTTMQQDDNANTKLRVPPYFTVVQAPLPVSSPGSCGSRCRPQSAPPGGLRQRLETAVSAFGVAESAARSLPGQQCRPSSANARSGLSGEPDRVPSAQGSRRPQSAGPTHGNHETVFQGSVPEPVLEQSPRPKSATAAYGELDSHWRPSSAHSGGLERDLGSTPKCRPKSAGAADGSDKAFDARYKMWGQLLRGKPASSEVARRPQSARLASDDLHIAVSGAHTEDGQMNRQILDDREAMRRRQVGTTRPPATQAAHIAMDSHHSVPVYDLGDNGFMQPQDPGTAFRGCHIRSPVRKKLSQREHHRRVERPVPWSVECDGMWFTPKPDVAVQCPPPAPWQDSAKRHPKGGKMGWQGKYPTCNPSTARTPNPTFVHDMPVCASAADLDTHSVGSLALNHSSAPMNIVAGTSHLPVTFASLGQLEGVDYEKLFEAVGGKTKDSWTEKMMNL